MSAHRGRFVVGVAEERSQLFRRYPAPRLRERLRRENLLGTSERYYATVDEQSRSQTSAA